MKKYISKYLTIIFISLFLVVSFMGTLNAAEKKLLVGVTFTSENAEYWQNLKKATLENIEKMGGDVMFLAAEDNAVIQMSQMEDFVTKKVDAIILVAVDSEAAVPSVNSAVEAGIPVIAMDRVVSKGGKVSCYVGTDNVLAGEMVAEYIAKNLNGKGNVVILNGPPEAIVARDRAKGFLLGLSKYPEIVVLSEKWSPNRRVDNMKVMEDLLVTFPKIDGVLGFCDNTSLGASDAIISAGLQNQIIIGSIDGMTEVVKLILSGGKNFPIIITVAQDPSMMAKYAALVAFEAASGNKVPTSINTWVGGITSNNAEEYLKSLK